MEDRQIIWPINRLMANPKVFKAVAAFFDGPDWEMFASTFYDLIEFELEESGEDPEFIEGEVCFREHPELPEVFQVVLSNGNAIELRPSGDSYTGIESEDELGLVSAIYGRLIKAIEIARPDLKGDVALCDMPTFANGFLRDEDGNAFRGSMHLLTDPDKQFNFVVDVISLDEDDLRAVVTPQ